MTGLVIGIGNSDRGDDGAGPFVVALLNRQGLPGVCARCVPGDPAELMAAWQGQRQVVVVDACAGGGEPGSIHRFDAVRAPLPEGFDAVSTHGFGLGAAVELARAMNGLPPVLTVYGIEGAAFQAGAPLSAAVRAAAEAVAAEIAATMEEGACTKRD